MNTHLRIISCFVTIAAVFLPVSLLQSTSLSPQGIQGTPGKEQLRATEDMAMVEARQTKQEVNPPLEIPPFMPVPENPIMEGEITPTTITNAPVAISIDSPPPASSFVALQDNNARIPPDTQGAVGLNHLMVTLNSQVRIQNRNGGTLSTVSLDSFWGSVNGGSGAFDPRVLYDPYSNRWISVACDDYYSASSGLLIGVTAGNDPLGTWYKFRIAASDTNWIDYPTIGFNKNWVVVTVNIYNSAGTYQRSEVYAFNKTAIYTGNSAPFTRFTLPYGVYIPAVTYDPNINTEYLIISYNSTYGIVRIAKITGAVSSETFTMISTNLTSTLGGWSQLPLDDADFAPQLGSVYKINNVDSRMQNLVYRNGSLWATHTIFLPAGGYPTRSAVQWWQISPTPSIIQNGRIDDNSGVNFYAFPSIAVNVNNDVLVGFSRFSPTQYASGNYAFRASSDPSNTMRKDVVLKPGEASYYKIHTGTKNRWGDFSASMVDPISDIDFWTIQEYAWIPGGGYDRWGTWWGRIVPPPLAFTKTNPTNVAAGIVTNPTLQWDLSNGANSYEYCIDTTSNNSCDSSWVFVGMNTSVPLNGLSHNTTYSWQVRANNPGGTIFANGDTWWSFTTTPYFIYLPFVSLNTGSPK